MSVTSSNPHPSHQRPIVQCAFWRSSKAIAPTRSQNAKKKAPAVASALRGLHKPQPLRSSKPKLYAVHFSVCTLLTLCWPRNQLRRPPPVSHTCANVRSHRSLRHRFKRRPFCPRTRRRFARKAAWCLAGLSVQRRTFCRRSGI